MDGADLGSNVRYKSYIIVNFSDLTFSSGGTAKTGLEDNAINQTHKGGTECYKTSMYCLFFKNAYASMKVTIHFFKIKSKSKLFDYTLSFLVL